VISGEKGKMEVYNGNASDGKRKSKVAIQLDLLNPGRDKRQRGLPIQYIRERG